MRGIHEKARAVSGVDNSHYRQTAIEPIDVIHAWGLGFNLGNVVKYVGRAGRKEGESELSDLRKAAWYLADHIHRLESAEGKKP